jgi:hypothetical protein
VTLITFDDVAINDMLNDPDGPVGELVAELSERGAVVAKATAPVRDTISRNRRRRAGLHSTAQPPGFTKGSIHVHGPVRGSRGGMYGGVNAAASATVFLEAPAQQMSHRYPFMTTGLDSLEILWPGCWVRHSSPSTRTPPASGRCSTSRSASRSPG